MISQMRCFYCIGKLTANLADFSPFFNHLSDSFNACFQLLLSTASCTDLTLLSEAAISVIVSHWQQN